MSRPSNQSEYITRPRIWHQFSPVFSYNKPSLDTTRSSKYGGTDPFFNPGDKWPLCASCGQPMSFWYQVDLAHGTTPPGVRELFARESDKTEGLGLFQLFWCCDEICGEDPGNDMGGEPFAGKYLARIVRPCPKAAQTLLDVSASSLAMSIKPEDSVEAYCYTNGIPSHLACMVSLVREHKIAEQQRARAVSFLRNPSNGWNSYDNDFGQLQPDRLLVGREKFITGWVLRESKATRAEEDMNQEANIWRFDASDELQEQRAWGDIEPENPAPSLTTFGGWPEWSPLSSASYQECKECYLYMTDLVLTSSEDEMFETICRAEDGWINVFVCPDCREEWWVAHESP